MDANSADRMTTVKKRLGEKGFRLTPQRLAIVTALVSSEAHPTADQIYNEIQSEYPTMSLATVYKTLDTLKDLGEVLELQFGAEKARYDGRTPDPHIHLMCRNCGKIQDLIADPVIPEAIAAMKSVGFQMEGYRFDLFGLCGECGHQ